VTGLGETNSYLIYDQKSKEDFLDSPEWVQETFTTEEFDEIKQDPLLKKWIEFDPSTLGNIDVHLEDKQAYYLGDNKIETLLTPGHSRGSICFLAGTDLFCGDLILMHRVGRTDLLGGSSDDIVNSVRRLYALLPDETRIYPGHGEFSTIGYEKSANESVTVDHVNLLY